MVEDVHIFHAETLQALVAACDQIFARTPFAVGTRPHEITRLGGDDELVAIETQSVFEDAPEVRFCGTRFGSVVVGEIEMSDAEIESRMRHSLRVVEVVDASEVVPQPEREQGQFDAAAAASAVSHCVIACFICLIHGVPFEFQIGDCCFR